MRGGVPEAPTVFNGYAWPAVLPQDLRPRDPYFLLLVFSGVMK